MEPVLILGARSWIGFRLTEALSEKYPNLFIQGTTSSENLKSLPIGQPDFLTAQSKEHFKKLISQKKYSSVINLLRGEDSAGLEIHQTVAEACFNSETRYVYASSALALDGYDFNRILTEDLPPLSISPYGQFKAACENYLKSNYPKENWIVLRFSSIQGWSPWRPSRNEIFLRKLQQSEQIKVSLGIKQNRIHDEVFARAVVDLISHPSAQGVFHLGTEDQSEEFDFLRQVARAFNYAESTICAEGERKVNLALSCQRLHQITQNRWKLTEKQTIQALVNDSHLSKLRKI